MKLLTMRSQIRDVAKEWNSQYAIGATDEQKEIGKQLVALNKETASDKAVEKIIGNKSWVEKKLCDECGKSSWETVRLGEEPDYESRTATICKRCLQKALALF